MAREAMSDTPRYIVGSFHDEPLTVAEVSFRGTLWIFIWRNCVILSIKPIRRPFAYILPQDPARHMG